MKVHVHPSGRFLYAPNRGADDIAVYGIDVQKGTLRLLQHISSGGRTPRQFALDPSGPFLLAANQGSEDVVVFRIAPDTGRLTPTDHAISVGTPVCMTFVPPR